MHELWLVACFLFPFLNEMAFNEDPTEREQFKIRAENLTRAMCSDLEALHLGIESSEAEIRGAEYNRHRAEGTTHEIEGPVKRRKFSLREQIEDL